MACRYQAARQEFALSVIDTGIGIADQDLTKIFEGFRQADDSVTRQYGSTFTFHVPRFGRKE